MHCENQSRHRHPHPACWTTLRQRFGVSGAAKPCAKFRDAPLPRFCRGMRPIASAQAQHLHPHRERPGWQPFQSPFAINEFSQSDKLCKAKRSRRSALIGNMHGARGLTAAHPSQISPSSACRRSDIRSRATRRSSSPSSGRSSPTSTGTGWMRPDTAHPRPAAGSGGWR